MGIGLTGISPGSWRQVHGEATRAIIPSKDRLEVSVASRPSQADMGSLNATPQRWEHGGHTVYWGDVLGVLPEIPDESVDLIFADPPYNIGKQFASFKDSWPSDEAYAAWCYEWLDMCVKKLRPAGSLYVMTSTHAMPLIDLHLRGQLAVLSRIVWSYDSSGVQAKRYFGSLYEPILHCVKDPRNYTFNAESIAVRARTGADRKLVDYRKPVPTEYAQTKVPGNVWHFPRVRYRMPQYEEHPAQKPEALLERVVLASSNPEDVVLDLFSGTFTTSAVAKRLSRNSIAIAPGERLELRPEPTNRYDPDAVMVWDSEGRHHVGYVPAEQAASIAEGIRNGKSYDARVIWEWLTVDGERTHLRMLVLDHR